MTPDSEGSEWVEREILLAQRERKPIFPLLLYGQENPLLITIQYADVTNGRMPPDNFYERLAQVAPCKPKFKPELIHIAAGEFLMGSDPKKDKDAEECEQPQHRLCLPDYYIAKTPVTNAQYLAFLESTGHDRPKHWERGKPQGGKEDHPVVEVTWHDAMDYCRWLAEATDRIYRLPSEAEWEKAARGSDGRIYPWGDDPPDKSRCNFSTNVEDTTPIEMYSPQGDSPCGCVDMAGNVWEWTRSLWGKDKPWKKSGQPDFKYPYDP